MYMANRYRQVPYGWWASLALILLVSLLSSCYPVGSFEEIRRSIQALPSQRLAWPLNEGYQDVRGAIHVHSFLSHDSKGRPEEILQAADEARLQFLIMTDHSNPKIFDEGMAGWQHSILVIRGMEIIKEEVSLLGIGMKEYIDHRDMPLQTVINKIKAQGALVFAAHPRTYNKWERLTGLDGMEIYDIYDDVTDHKTRYFRYLFDILFAYNRYPDEVFLSILDRPEKELASWDRKTQSTKMVAIGGNDAHQNVRLFGRQLDPYSRSLHFVNSHLFVVKLDETSILNALLQGRGYVSFDILADPTGFLFGAQDEKKFWLMGEEVSFKEGIKIVAHSPLAGEARLIKDGKVIYKAQGTRLEFIPLVPGVYRVEWYLHLSNRWWPWIFSNPIYLKKDGAT